MWSNISVAVIVATLILEVLLEGATAFVASTPTLLEPTLKILLTCAIKISNKFLKINMPSIEPVKGSIFVLMFFDITFLTG